MHANFEWGICLTQAKQRFLELYQTHIKREGAQNLLSWLQASDFFSAPASTRYHGSYEGGLLEHSLHVYDCLTAELAAAGLSDVYADETVTIAALLHDICKVHMYKKGTRNVKENGQWTTKDVFEIDEQFPCGHGEKSVILLQTFLRLTPDEIYAIRAHMGGWDDSVRGGARFVGKIFEKSNLALLLHIADMKATYLLEGTWPK